MISRPCAECRLPVGSSARISFGLGDHRARDADQLLLAAGELRWDRGPSSRRCRTGRACRRPSPARSVLLHVPVRERDLEILGDRQIVEQVVLLEDEADVRACCSRARCFCFSACTGWPTKWNSPVQALSSMPRMASSVRLARAGRAHDGDELAGRDVEVDAAQQEELPGRRASTTSRRCAAGSRGPFASRRAVAASSGESARLSQRDASGESVTSKPSLCTLEGRQRGGDGWDSRGAAARPGLAGSPDRQLRVTSA